MKLSEVQIRRARPADAEVLTRIAHAAKRHWGYADELIDLWKRDLTVTPELIEADSVYCASDRSRILGFYAFSETESQFELEHMWVDPEYIGSGLGTMLFRHAAETLRSIGAASLEIASDPHAEGFYRRMGAHRVGVVPSAPPGRELPLLVLRLESRHGDLETAKVRGGK